MSAHFYQLLNLHFCDCHFIDSQNMKSYEKYILFSTQRNLHLSQKVQNRNVSKADEL